MGTDTLPVHYVRLNEAIEIVKAGRKEDKGGWVDGWRRILLLSLSWRYIRIFRLPRLYGVWRVSVLLCWWRLGGEIMERLTNRIQDEKRINKANKILDDIFNIFAIILFPMWILKLLGYDKLIR